MTPGLVARVFLPFALGYYLSYLFRSVNAVIAPDLVADLGVDAAILGLLTSAYFLAFAAFQLPLGILLDRLGPTRTEAALLVFAAIGSLLFAVAQSAPQLIFGRALIGFGVSACLMAAFKSFVLWFPKERLPAINGSIMAAGGLGAMTATAPVEAALGIAGWRGVFVALAAAALISAAVVLLVVPKRAAAGGGETFREQLRGVGRVFSDGYFWAVAPMTVTSQMTWFAVQGLWAGPWLHDIGGLDRGAVANILFMIAALMVVSFLSMGFIAERLGRLGVPTVAVAATGMSVFAVIQIPLVMGWSVPIVPQWGLFAIFGTSGIVAYAGLSQHFPPELAGRVNTGLNFLVFSAAFVAQAGIGAIIGLFPETGGEGFAPAGYRAGFGTMLALQAVALGWFGWRMVVARRARFGIRERA